MKIAVQSQAGEFGPMAECVVNRPSGIGSVPICNF
jgi:hypothetical protein